MLLENGDVLVPEEGGTGMVRLSPGDKGHAEWLAHLQRQQRPEPEPRRRGPEPQRERGSSAGRTVAGCGFGFVLAFVVVALLLVFVVLWLISAIGNVEIPQLPDLPGLPEDLPQPPSGGG
jgi:hypothetical protein